MDDKPIDEALDTIPIAPPQSDVNGPNGVPTADNDDDSPDRGAPNIREAHDAEVHSALANNPKHEDAKLDIGLDESFPSSDPPATTAPGHGEPSPSSGYDEDTEKRR